MVLVVTVARDGEKVLPYDARGYLHRKSVITVTSALYRELAPKPILNQPGDCKDHRGQLRTDDLRTVAGFSP